MNLQENYSLKKENTFRVDVSAKYFAQVHSEEELKEVLENEKVINEKKLILGEGANILFTKDYDGLVIKLRILGIKTVTEDNDHIIVEAKAGENWHEFVMYAVENNWGGIENMVYIPGTVGAAAVQNIAAYGQNLSDVFISLTALEIESGEIKEFSKKECGFSYRDSRFKTKEMGRYVVLSIKLKLEKNPKINTTYFETGKSFAKNVSLVGELANIENPSIKDVASAVMNIRKNKLPDIREVGTAGSFFRNPIVSYKRYLELKQKDPDLQCYPVDGLRYVDSEELKNEENVKIPAARLLDNIGWKGKRIGNVGTHPTQALAVVNYGASGEEILSFTEQMKKAVLDNYQISLEPEVLIL